MSIADRVRDLIAKLEASRPKRIGFWYSTHEPWLPRPQELVDRTWGEPDRSMVVRYLRDPSHRRTPYMGYSECRFCGKDNGVADLDDGVYVWPEGLAHCLVVHYVRLPQEFVEHVRRREPS